jgi:hypothetical protein
MRQNKQGDLSFEGAPCLFCVIEQAGTEAQDAIGILLLRRRLVWPEKRTESEPQLRQADVRRSWE